jgi:hypothetical protein
MDRRRIGFVVSHPAHLLTVVGMVLRWRPHVLLLTGSAAPAAAGQGDLIRRGLAMIGLEDRVHGLAIDEAQSYREALAGNFAFHMSVTSLILDWIKEFRPEAIFGDAFELTNYHHDVGRVLLDAAIKRSREDGLDVTNYEFPLSFRAARVGAPLQFGVFPSGYYELFRLSREEIATKVQIIDWAARLDKLIAELAPLFPGPEIERYRKIPPDRDYSVPPPGLARHYDDRGREEVTAGRYTHAISFEGHFVPLVRFLAAHCWGVDNGTPAAVAQSGRQSASE